MHNDWAELSQEIGQIPAITFSLLPPGLTSGRRLQHILANIETWKKPYTCKFGYTAVPPHRWKHCKDAYVKDPHKWKVMVLLHVTLSSVDAGWLEAALISHHLGHPGNKNILPGGDSIHNSTDMHDPFANSIYFTYVVFKSLIKPDVIKVRSRA